MRGDSTKMAAPTSPQRQLPNRSRPSRYTAQAPSTNVVKHRKCRSQ